MPMVTFRGPARALRGSPNAEASVADPETLARLHGLHTEDASCLDELLDPDLVELGLEGGRLRFEYDEAAGRLWVVTSFVTPRTLSDDELSRLRQCTEEQWCDGLGAGSFWNHAGDVPSSTLAKAACNQDPELRFVPEQLFVEACPPEEADVELEVTWSDEGDPDHHVLADLRWAMERGMPSAFFELGRCHDAGDFAPEDPEKAAELYRTAAEQGHGLAMGMLGSLYREGRGLEKDPAQAVAWFQKGMEAGEVLAKAEYADCVELGEGTEQDLVRARELYRECLEAGFEPVTEALERVEVALAEG